MGAACPKRGSLFQGSGSQCSTCRLLCLLCSRRQLWALVPWDPAAPFVLYRKHQQVYAQLQEQAYDRRLFTADQPAPPSQLREGRTLLQVGWGGWDGTGGCGVGAGVK